MKNAKKIVKKAGLPKEFKKYFWDVDFKKLSLKAYPEFVMSRIMSLGNMQAVRWMLDVFNKKTLKKFVLDSGNRQLDRRSNNFWRIYFGLPALRAEPQGEAGKPVSNLWPH